MENNLNIKTVTVIGATGTMGLNVAGIFASFGNAKVYCVGRDKNKVERTIPKIIQSVKADSIAKRLIPCDYSNLDECITDSDLIFESVVEDIEIKKDIARRVSKSMRENAISCTGTSGLSVNQIANEYSKDNRSRFYGVHMFNPPYSLSLCELIASQFADNKTTKSLKEYLENTLYRTVVQVKDAPAFLGNRIGFNFINEALKCADKYKDNGGIDYIDAILGPFTGRVMAPLLTSDFVGLDVHKAIVDNLYINTNDAAHETFIFPEFANNLIKENKLGRKTGSGLYKIVLNKTSQKQTLVYDINLKDYRKQIPYVFPFAENMKNHISCGEYSEAIKELINNKSQESLICLDFALKYIFYSLITASEATGSLDSADDAMATGFNWCPPIAIANEFSKITDLVSLYRERFPNLFNISDVESLIKNIPVSKYDVRPFLKSGR